MGTVAIITPTLNRNINILKRCADSVRNQTYGDWEHIICSDGVRELAVETFVQQRNDPRIRYSWTSQRTGHYGAGVRACLTPTVSANYLAYLDDDNVLFPKFLEKMVGALAANPQCGFAICQIVHFGPLPEHLWRALGDPPVILRGVPPVVMNIDTLQVLVRKEAMQKTGWMLEEYCSDGFTYEKLGREHQWVVVDEVLGMHL